MHVTNQNNFGLFRLASFHICLLQVSGVVKVMDKERVGENLIKLSENNQSSLWFVNSKEIPIDVSFYLLIYFNVKDS